MSLGGEGGGAGDDDSEADSFASLLEDANPLESGPDRLPPTPPRSHVRLRRGGTQANTSNRSPAAKFRWPDPENRHQAAAEGVNEAQLAALCRGEPEPLERIDLHGARREAAKRLLTKRLESAHSRGLDCVIVIHGRGQRSASGEAVLRDALPDWLSLGANAQHVLAFTPAPDRLGGSGATLVLLRSN
jgi:DNA-nicking Smr family endonuclease